MRYRSKTLQILKSTQVVNVHSMLSSISCDLFIVDQVVDLINHGAAHQISGESERSRSTSLAASGVSQSPPQHI
jgi:hypothetical protein